MGRRVWIAGEWKEVRSLRARKAEVDIGGEGWKREDWIRGRRVGRAVEGM